MKTEFSFNGQSSELNFTEFWYNEKMALQLRDDENKYTVVEATGQVIYDKVPMFTDPSFTARLRRTNDTEEDIIIIQPKYKATDTADYFENPKDTLYGRCVLLPEDIKKLWPNYREDMTRDEINALPAKHPTDVFCRFGIYLHLNADGSPKVDENGNPIIDTSTKWVKFIIDGKEFEASGDKREYVPASAKAEKKEGENN